MFRRRKLVFGELTCYKFVVWRFGILMYSYQVGNICEAQHWWDLSSLRLQILNDFNANPEGATILERVCHSCTQLMFWILSVIYQKMWDEFFNTVLPDFFKCFAFWKVPRLRPFVLPVRITCRWRWVGNTGGVIRENHRSARRKSSPSATLFTTNLTWTELGSDSGFLSERPATDRLSHSTATNWISISAYLTENSRSPLWITVTTRDLN